MTEDTAKQIIRRLDVAEKLLNTIYNDRELLETISIRIGTLEDKVKYLSDRVNSMEKNTKADIRDVSENVENMKDEVAKVTEVITT